MAFLQICFLAQGLTSLRSHVFTLGTLWKTVYMAYQIFWVSVDDEEFGLKSLHQPLTSAASSCLQQSLFLLALFHSGSS